MLELLLNLDQKLFFVLNTGIANFFLDTLMPWMTNKKNWYLPGGLLWLGLMWKGGKKGRVLGILVIVGIALSDQISSSFLKPWMGRIRPCKSLDSFRLLTHCGGPYGFPSSHASTIATIGSLFMLNYKRWRPFWGVLIFLMGFSRIYVGVHYPLDVACGWILGICIGGILTKLYLLAASKMVFLKN